MRSAWLNNSLFDTGNMLEKKILENGFVERDKEDSDSSFDKVGYVHRSYTVTVRSNLSKFPSYLKQVQLNLFLMCMKDFNF